MSDATAPLPKGWYMTLPGYAVDHGQTKQERAMVHVVRTCDARGGVVKTWAHDGGGVPTAVVHACLRSQRPALVCTVPTRLCNKHKHTRATVSGRLKICAEVQAWLHRRGDAQASG